MQVKICCGFSDSSHAQHCAINTAGKKKKNRSDGSGGYQSREEDSRKAKVIIVKN